MSLTFGSSWGDRSAGNLDLSPRTSCTGGWWAGWCGLWGQSHASPYCIRLPLTNFMFAFGLFVCFCLIIRTAMLAKWFYEFWILVWSQWQPPVFTTHKFNKRGWDAARGHSFRGMTQIKTEQGHNEAAVIVGMKASPRSYVLSWLFWPKNLPHLYAFICYTTCRQSSRIPRIFIHRLKTG